MDEGMPVKHFEEIVELIQSARTRALQSVNRELIELYWQVGEYISRKVDEEGWGKGVVRQLAQYLKQQEPNLKGFSDKNLWRMKQLFETYKDSEKLSALLRELSWTNNMTILSRCNTIEEKEFYIRLSI